MLGYWLWGIILSEGFASVVMVEWQFSRGIIFRKKRT